MVRLLIVIPASNRIKYMYLIYKRLVRHSHQRHISKPNIIKAKNMTDNCFVDIY